MSDEEVSRLSLLVDELTAQRDAFGQKAHQLQERVEGLAGGRDERQRAVLRWVEGTFGPVALAPVERAARLLEEVVELAQAAGLSRHLAFSVFDHVYGKPPGEPAQEAGGVGVTLLAYCESVGLSADGEEAREFARVLATDPAHFRARHNAKADAGVAVRVEVPEVGQRVLHLMTQRDQPYGSTRRCCERCGVMLGANAHLNYTDNQWIYDNPPPGKVSCEEAHGDRLPAP